MSVAAPRDFWSRRRAAVQAEAEAERAAEDARAQAQDAADQAAFLEGKSDGEVLEALGLKDPDEMQMGDDFAAFLGRAVPEHLRRRALRRLWVSNPVLANLDGLVDHAEDYTDAAVTVPGMRTAYQVGRGMAQHIAALAEAAEAAEHAETEAPEENAETGETGGEDTVAVSAEEAAVAIPVPETAACDTAEAALPRRRHMRFHFVEADT